MLPKTSMYFVATLCRFSSYYIVRRKKNASAPTSCPVDRRLFVEKSLYYSISYRLAVCLGEFMFGTDGIRGIYGEKITPMLFFGLGLAVAEIFGGTAVVARDTRLSGEELCRAVSDGLQAGGINVIDGGIAPSPALAKAINFFGADFGIMITASHNPPEYNGIKIFDREGAKISGDKERLIEFYLAHTPKRRALHGHRREENIVGIYAESLKCRFADDVTVDYAFGAGCVLKTYFDARAFNDLPDGSKINEECGALHPRFLLSHCKTDWGFALDGDADRLAVVYKNEILDGTAYCITSPSPRAAIASSLR